MLLSTGHLTKQGTSANQEKRKKELDVELTYLPMVVQVFVKRHGMVLVAVGGGGGDPCGHVKLGRVLQQIVESRGRRRLLAAAAAVHHQVRREGVERRRRGGGRRGDGGRWGGARLQQQLVRLGPLHSLFFLHDLSLLPSGLGRARRALRLPVTLLDRGLFHVFRPEEGTHQISRQMAYLML